MGKGECLEIVSKLADKTLSFGCLIDWGKWGQNITGERRAQVRPYGWRDDGDNEEFLPPDKIREFIKSHPEVKIVGHPVLLARVLTKLCIKKGLFDVCQAEEILDIWRKCGLEKSLQAMVDEGFIKKEHEEDGYQEFESWTETHMKNGNAEILFELLKELCNK